MKKAMAIAALAAAGSGILGLTVALAQTEAPAKAPPAGGVFVCGLSRVGLP